MARPEGVEPPASVSGERSTDVMSRSLTFVLLALIAASVRASGYNCKDWPHWEDLDGDCQNTRAEILIRDSRIPVQFKDHRECSVVAGEWFGPYTGRPFYLCTQCIYKV